MGTVETLRARGNLAGRYVRPAGSDGWPPAVGTPVAWVASQPVQDLLDQGRRLGWRNLGTIGNTAHLRGHGDHTGHSGGKQRGVVYAKDTALPDGGRAALLKLCRTDDYDTTWIDFFNVDGRQYNFAGTDVGWSGDQHLHVSVRRGHELRKVTLFTDMKAVMDGTYGKPKKTLPAMPDIFNRLGFIDGATLVMTADDPTIWLTGRGKRAKVSDMNELERIQAYMRARNMQDGVITIDVTAGEEV